jgi:hypothetical protein
MKRTNAPRRRYVMVKLDRLHNIKPLPVPPAIRPEKVDQLDYIL